MLFQSNVKFKIKKNLNHQIKFNIQKTNKSIDLKLKLLIHYPIIHN